MYEELNLLELMRRIADLDVELAEVKEIMEDAKLAGYLRDQLEEELDMIVSELYELEMTMARKETQLANDEYDKERM